MEVDHNCLAVMAQTVEPSEEVQRELGIHWDHVVEEQVK